MKSGKDYIVFALDFPSREEAVAYVRLLDGYVGMFKIGLELFVQCGPDIVKSVRALTDAGIFLDLKFHDISMTVRRAVERGAALGADLITVHCSSSRRMLEMAVKGGRVSRVSGGLTGAGIPGSRISGAGVSGARISEAGVSGARISEAGVSGARISGAGVSGAGILGVTLLTDNDAEALGDMGFQERYVRDVPSLVMDRAQMAYDAGCRGVVCSGDEAQRVKSRFGRDFLVVTPGIRPAWSVVKGDDQKRITTPAMAVNAGADLIVVGRPIKTAHDPCEAARRIAREIDEL
ncbi:MAG: orotidine 5'-phosphate decarboxylase [Desulfamplus sp.]|nr:orotidine 5'-phosphate decarboxylase [Desulfamplus sp.]